MSLVIEFIGVVTVLIVLFSYYIKWAQKYWARRNVPYIESTSIWGNMENPLTMKHGIKNDIKKVHDELKKRGHIHGGMYLFTQPAYVPVDVELIKRVLAKDFQHFSGHGIPINEKREPLTAHLFNLDGEEWRNMRVKLTPTFTSGKMKLMFSTLLDCGVPMLEHIDQLSNNQQALNIKDILGCYTTDVIGSCAFGLECNSFKDPNAEFRKYGRLILKPSIYTSILLFITLAIPPLRKLTPIRFLSKEVETFFIGAIKNIMDHRKDGSVHRNDFVQLFLEINKKAGINSKEALTLNQIAAQAFVFFVAGFETSSTTMTFCLHELAFNQDIQDKLREEVRETMKKHDGKLTYDGVMDMKYMDQVINETLRKYPPVPFINRICTSDYKVPDTDVTITAGTKVFISALGLHRDEEYYPDPENFDPDRFTEENKANRPAYAFLPFGEGPRICIGLRFGLMQTKTGISMLLNNYRILPVPGDPYNFELEPKSFVLTKKGNVMLNVQRLSS